MVKRFSILLAVAALLIVLVASSSPQQTKAQETPALTIYSGRNENLVGPLLQQFEQDTGIRVDVRYGGSTDLAVQLLEEGEGSPADVFFSQDAGALGLVENNGLLVPLSSDILDLVDPRFSSDEGFWVGVTGRARVVVYNTDVLSPEDLPTTITEFTDSKWADKIGWAPSNASLQAFVTALRVTAGEDAARSWLEGIVANNPRVYPNNGAVVAAIATGEIEVGFVNHYYIYQHLAEHPDAPVANYFFPSGDVGSMINVAGVGILNSTDVPVLAQRFVLYLLSIRGQQYFAEQTYEYPLLVYGDLVVAEGLPPLEEHELPDLDLSDLADLETTLTLLEEVGAFDE